MRHGELTSLAWSPDGGFVACGSPTGPLEVWEAEGFTKAWDEDSGARSAIQCVAWGTGPTQADLPLVFAGDDHVVHFRNYRNAFTPDVERGIGHQSPVLAAARSLDGKAVVSGTLDETIGVRKPTELTNELSIDRSVLAGHFRA